jgi:hypothetical protein
MVLLLEASDHPLSSRSVDAGAGPHRWVKKFDAHERQASEQDKRARLEAVEEGDLRCFVTFSGPEDDDAVLGLGLYAYPRSALQRRLRLPPELDIVGDYVDFGAFNTGVHRTTPPRWDAEDTNNELPSMVSSSRRRLNGWIPLYVNSRHWARARPSAASAFSYLARGNPAGQFQAKDALNVCCNLLTCAVTGFTKGQCEHSSSRAARRVKASERAVQMYADVHRLLLQLAHEHPEMRTLVPRHIVV